VTPLDLHALLFYYDAFISLWETKEVDKSLFEDSTSPDPLLESKISRFT
jgi:hypothetical protein